MLDLDRLTAKLREALVHNPARGGTFKFAVDGLGVFFVDATAVSNDDRPADCVLRMDKNDFEEVLVGALDPQTAMMDGRLELTGDVAIATAMQPALAAAWMTPDA